MSGWMVGALADVGHLLIAALGVWVLKGQAGVLCLGQSGFMAVGAYAYALSARAGLPLPLALLFAIVLAGSVAVVISPALVGSPTNGAALATMAVVVIAHGVAVGWRDLTGGASGLRGVPGLAADPFARAGIAWAVVILLMVLLAWLVRSRPGLAMRAVRDDAASARRCGVPLRRTRGLALVLCAACGGLAGAMMGAGFGFISPDMFEMPLAISILAMVVVGGERSMAGPVLGALFLYWLPELVGASREWQSVGQGLLLLLVVLRFPIGMAGALARVGTLVRRGVRC